MFPNPHDLPAKPAECAVHAAVAGHVRSELLFPEWTIASGDFAMLGTAMPKTSVHKEGEPHSPENEIGLAENFLIPAPAGDVVLAE
jgi:hypothetical protein